MNPWFLLLTLPPFVFAAIVFYHLGEIRRQLEELRGR